MTIEEINRIYALLSGDKEMQDLGIVICRDKFNYNIEDHIDSFYSGIRDLSRVAYDVVKHNLILDLYKTKLAEEAYKLGYEEGRNRQNNIDDE